MTHLDQIESRLKEINARCEGAKPKKDCPWCYGQGYWTDDNPLGYDTIECDCSALEISVKANLPAVVKALREATDAICNIARYSTCGACEQNEKWQSDALSTIASILGGESK